MKELLQAWGVIPSLQQGSYSSGPALGQGGVQPGTVSDVSAFLSASLKSSEQTLAVIYSREPKRCAESPQEVPTVCCDPGLPGSSEPSPSHTVAPWCVCALVPLSIHDSHSWFCPSEFRWILKCFLNYFLTFGFFLFYFFFFRQGLY